MVLTCVYNASVLYPAPLRDLLIRLANTDLVQAKWTAKILDEVFAALAVRRSDLSADRLARTRKLMESAILDVKVVGYERLIPDLCLPDPDDRHVVAAAIQCGAQVIVTSNLKHFPAAVLGDLGIEAQTADQLVLSLSDLSRSTVWQVIRQQATALRSPPRSPEELLEVLRRNGLASTVEVLRR